MARELLSDGIDQYLRFRASTGIGKRTLANERTTLKLFLAVNGNLWMHKVDQGHVVRFKEEAAKTRRPASLRPMHSCLSQFFAWGRSTKRMDVDQDPLFGMKPPKGVKKQRQRVPVARFGDMLNAASERSEWHRALVATLLYTLLREGEVRDLRIRDLRLDDGYLRARITKSSLEDDMPISSDLDGELRRWLTAYTVEVGPLQPHYFLIPARVCKGLVHNERGKIETTTMVLKPEQKAGAVARHVTPILNDVGIDVSEKGEGGHTIRRSGARALFDALSEQHHPRPLRVVKDMLHHATEATTELYIGVEADRLDRDRVVRGKPLYGTAADIVKLNEWREAK